MFRVPGFSTAAGTLAVFVTTAALTLSVAGPASAAPTHAARTHVAAVQAVPASVAAARLSLAKAARAHCYGRNNNSIQWFGHQIKLDSCNASRLQSALGVGAGALGAVAVILGASGVGAAVAGAFAAALGVMSGAIGWCAANGTGIILDESWAGVAWCASQ